ncbi:MAG: Asp-tRNA(Asn)/Glu-tRNA(Gln) amidotransferase subunit GatB [Thermoleophilia bacterium]|nr:Asp-tRNA(Asn)/Glu-tRNA(Gln) amidotransferase subunit GatB [Thermoleophilia bacterium]
MAAGTAYEPVIGLEIHVELSTKSKMFCGCEARFGGIPNTRTCPVCSAQPGALPVINREAIRHIARIALALDCRIAPGSIFHRKNYFYPDLPKGYQISQYDMPFAVEGHLDVTMDGEQHRVGIERVHQEEDTGKNIHAGESGRIAGAIYSLIDFNRCGIPLVEIVTKPDIHSPQVARSFLNKLKNTLQYLDVSDCNMEEGSLRCDANVSVRPAGSDLLGVKTELKNMNSFKHLEKGLAKEIERQIGLLEAGRPVVQQTVHYEVASGEVHPMRSKEYAHDYRYFPEPDLSPLEISQDFVDDVRTGMPELPSVRAARYVTELNLPEYDAEVLTSNRDTSDFFDETLNYFDDQKMLSNWVMGDLGAYLNASGKKLSIETVSPGQADQLCWLSPAGFGEFLAMIKDGEIAAASGKAVLPEMCETGKTAREIVEEKGLAQISDTARIEALIDRVIEANPEQREQYKSGKKQVLGYFVGQVMKESGGRANPRTVNEILREKL